VPNDFASSKTKLWRRPLAAMLLVAGLLLPALACGGPATEVPPDKPVTPESPASGNTGGQLPAWLKVYFTNPDPPDEVANGIDRYVVPALNKAAKTIDVASFDLNLPSGVQALAGASQRGVKVRVIVDGVNGDQELDAKRSPTGKTYKALTVLKNAGVSVVDGGRSNGLMHNKMIIIDSLVLFMGSWNLSYNDTFRNNNNLLKITSQKLIANYQAKFDEGFDQQAFGTHAQVGAANPQLTLSGVQVENYFSPVDGVMDKLIAYVAGAQKSIHFMAFTYTDKNLAAAMIDRAQAGVEVQGVIENRGASQGALVPLFCAKLPVQVDGNKYTMHHKVIILDGETVITGSFNFTKSADDANDDNVLVIHNAAVAALYEQEYGRVKALATAPDSVTCK
jgi:phosphatidylserine/phosphatidylglycerophosphate/cardiolipin synthase-like enzyme